MKIQSVNSQSNIAHRMAEQRQKPPAHRMAEQLAKGATRKSLHVQVQLSAYQDSQLQYFIHRWLPNLLVNMIAPCSCLMTK